VGKADFLNPSEAPAMTEGIIFAAARRSHMTCTTGSKEDKGPSLISLSVMAPYASSSDFQSTLLDAAFPADPFAP
jgi:hypothetical protein